MVVCFGDEGGVGDQCCGDDFYFSGDIYELSFQAIIGSGILNREFSWEFLSFFFFPSSDKIHNS